jgi:hypothetical protein
VKGKVGRSAKLYKRAYKCLFSILKTALNLFSMEDSKNSIDEELGCKIYLESHRNS